ncbi:MAG: MFS transporter [Rickettsiales bacterium]|nr:MFS transporter [Rickettsiales bacterium]
MKKVIAACMIGNALEWYDFALFGQFAVILSKLFFPQHDSYVGMVATYTIFATGFLMRPIGGIIFGYIGDRYGRKVSLVVSILMMALPTALIGVLPTYDQIGIWAPIILCLIRLIQGASIGGEFSGCIAFLVEYSPMNKRGLIGSVSMISLVLGMLLGSVVAILVSKCMPVESFETWGWRIPFLIGIVIAIIGIYVRLGLRESPIYIKAKEKKSLSQKPVREIFNEYLPPLFIAIGLYLTVTVPFYSLTIFIQSYMSKYMGFSYNEALNINLMSLSILIIILPISAYFSDIYGRKKVMRYSAYGIVLFIYPIIWLLHLGNFNMAIVSQVIFAILVGAYMGPIPAVLVELFPTRVRFTGVALSYNLSAALFGGTAPLVATWLVTNIRTDSIAMYIILFVVLTLITLKYYKETYRKALV